MSFFRNIFRALSRTERRALLAAGFLVLAGIAGLVTLFIEQRTVAVPAHSGAYSEGMVGQPSSVNPVLASSEADQALSRLTFADLQQLTDSILNTTDGKTVTVKVHLRPGLQWSDGEPLTSDDVLFTLQSIQDPASRSPLAGLFAGVTAERVSALEIDFHLTNLLLEDTIPTLAPLPKHLYGDIPPTNWHLSDYNLRPVGSGPYVFVSHDSASDGFVNTYVLAVNPHYVGTAPYIQQVKVFFFRTADDLLAAFNSGQVQGFGTTDPTLLDGIKRPYALTRFTTPTVYAVFWNQSANTALQAAEVRQALDLAADRSQLLEAVKGYGEIAAGPLPPALGVRNTADAASTTNTGSPVDRAAALLSAKGWSKGNDGVWTKKIGKADVRTELTLTVPDIRFLKDAAQKLVDQWNAFGVAAHLKVLAPGDELTAAVTNRSYDGLLFGNTVRGTGDLYPFWDSSGRFAPGLNLAIYQNTKVDTLLQKARTELDQQAAQTDLLQVENLIGADEPAVFLFSTDDLYVASKSVRGVSADFLENPADRLQQLPQWYVATTRKLK